MRQQLAIGFFDGVHAGHRRILEAARARGGEVRVLTFTNHPREVLDPGGAPPLLQRPQDRAAALLDAGADAVDMDAFTPLLASVEPSAYVKMLLERYPGLDAVFCGEDWRFGRGGAGSAQTLCEMGVAVQMVPPIEMGGAPVSSSRIRSALAAGDAALAAAMLGRPYEIRGTVETGKGIGRTIGRPTLNVRAFAPALRGGVWALDSRWGRAVANWGFAPTAGAGAWRERILEVHFATRPAGLAPPGAETEFSAVRFIRDERTFPSWEALRAQIARDVAEAME